MTETKMSQQKSRFRIIHVPRELSFTKKIKPYVIDDQVHGTKNSNELKTLNTPFISTPTKSLETHAPIQTITPSINELTIQSNPTRPSSTVMNKFYPSGMTNRNETKQGPLDSENPSKGCCSQLSSKQKLIIKLAIITLVIVGVAGAVLPPVYVFIIRQTNPQSSSTNVTVSACSSTTCIGSETPYHSSMVTVLYPFDGNVNDLTGSSSGSLFGTALPGFTTNAYVGTYALYLNSTANQYVQIPYINLGQQSFTLQMWIFPTGSIIVPSDYGIFGQCDSNSICFLLTLRNGRITLSFDSMNTNNNTLIGSTVININTWNHITVVYDAVLYQQSIYINGRIDAIARGMVASYKGTSSGSVTTIGRSLSLASGYTYFTGRIDHFTASVGVARNACQILNDATLSGYYPFDTNGTYNDYSVNYFNGIAVGVTTLSRGRLNQAIYFPSTTSYFQASPFTSTRVYSFAFTFSLWVKPASVTGGGSLVHISYTQTGIVSMCYDLLAFTSNGALVAQWAQGGTNIVNATQGPIIPANTWTHVAVMYGVTNGLRLFVNGQLSASSLNTGGTSYAGFDNQQYVTLGTNNPWGLSTASTCQNGTITILPGQFIGGIDEFRLYSREIDNQELCVLANI